jgi:hypothetical protein
MMGGPADGPYPYSSGLRNMAVGASGAAQFTSAVPPQQPDTISATILGELGHCDDRLKTVVEALRGIENRLVGSQPEAVDAETKRSGRAGGLLGEVDRITFSISDHLTVLERILTRLDRTI